MRLSRLLLGLVLVGRSPLGAQTLKIGIATGAIITPGYNSENSDHGWHLLGAVEVGSSLSAVAVRMDVMHGETESVGLTGGTANVVYHISRAAGAPARVYLLAGLGLYHLTFQPSLADAPSFTDTRSAFAGGAGVSVGVRPTRFFGEARFIKIRTDDYGETTNFVLITAGVSFGK